MSIQQEDTENVNRSFVFKIGREKFSLNFNDFTAFVDFFAFELKKGRSYGDGANNFSINRNPKFFRHLLEILHVGKEAIPDDDALRTQLHGEAKYFKLVECEKKIEEVMQERKSLHDKYKDFTGIVFSFGGKGPIEYTIDKNLILKSKTLFKELMDAKSPPRDSKGNLWINRDCKNVDLVIKSMAREALFLPTTMQELEDLIADAIFFKTPELEDVCREELHRLQNAVIVVPTALAPRTRAPPIRYGNPVPSQAKRRRLA